MKLIIIAGANGSRKITFATEYIKEFKCVYLNPDEIKIHENLNDINASKQFLIRLKNTILNKKDILIETTLSGKYIFKVIKEAKLCGYSIELILCNVYENIKRVEIRYRSKE